MIKMTLTDIAACVHGVLFGHDIDINGLSIDTRTLQKGQLYVAISGKNFDGHDFVDNAAHLGAAAVLVHEKIATHLPQILVANTHLALAQIAGAWRERMNLNVIGVTGSNGKTTTKEMLASILSVNDEVWFTQGNLNNDIGVPLTLLCLSPVHRYAVIEMGANHVGEIAYTSQFAKANVAIVTNVGAAHLEGFGSIDNIAKAKGELFEALGADGIAILNADDVFFDYWMRVIGKRKKISFGLTNTATVCAENIVASDQFDHFITQFDLRFDGQRMRIDLPLAGHHNVLNALGAAASSLALGISLTQIKQGLEKMVPVKGRLQLQSGYLGCMIINDTYNANTASLKVALDVLTQSQGEHWVVLGAFGELGEESDRLHSEMGNTLKKYKIKQVFAVGEKMKHAVTAFGENGHYFNSQEDLLNALIPRLTGNETLLIKGSRAQRMENIAAALVNTTGN
ncbi:MAG: UDP-N-acetylmuramoyl-tripeptide--D-alanyl-D-alanine ligase [Pseudomonadota bacterium]|nr:UDP-N-acetylmuramoyl-tripeptide--D-alanyl-D-alanine ligase [Pseudomonadota bacterium]